MRSLRAFAVLLAAAWSSACSIHPIPDDVTGYSTVDIVAKIRCEARAAVLAHASGPQFAGAGIGFDFTFTITETNGIGAAAKFQNPFSSGFGRTSLDIGATQDRQRQTERKFILIETFQELRRVDCPLDDARPNWRYPITGTIGLNEVVKTFVELDAPTSALSGFSEVLVFTTAFGGSVRPKVELNPLPGKFRLVEGSGLLAGDRKDVHKVRITLDTDKVKSLESRMGGVEESVKDRILRDLYRQRSLDNSDQILDILRNR